MNQGTQIKDPYKTLGVSADASDEEIKRAYRKLAKRYHPDSTGGDKKKEARFKAIAGAYDVIGDSKKRAQYDAMRRGELQPDFGGSAGAAPGGFDLGDLFSMFSGGKPEGGRVEYRVYRGGQQDAGPDLSDLFGFQAGQPKRKRPAKKSPPRQRERKLRASDGSLIVQRGEHVYSDIRLSIDKAILGTVESVATLEGKASVKVPPGTSSGVKLRLKGKGPVNSRGKRGSHYVTVHIDVPKEIDADAKKLLVKLMRKLK